MHKRIEHKHGMPTWMLLTGFVLLFLTIIVGCTSLDKRGCELYAREMKAFHTCAQDSACPRSLQFYKEGFRKLEWLNNNCPLENNP